MRIIAGKHRGALLQEFELKDKTGLRPTTDRNRESLFNIIENSRILKEQGFSLKDSIILDGFCGTGSVGLEALSRGAKFVTFVEKDKKHIEIAKANAKKIHESQNCEFIRDDITNLSDFSQKSELELEQKYNLIFLDPPYKKGLIEKSLKELIKNNLIDNNTIIIIEHSSKERDEINQDMEKDFIKLDERKYGKTTFQILKLNN